MDIVESEHKSFLVFFKHACVRFDLFLFSLHVFFLFVGSILCGGGCRGRGYVSVALLNGDGTLFDGTL